MLLLYFLPMQVFADENYNLQQLFCSILEQETDSAKISANKKFNEAFAERLAQSDSFTANFDSLPNVGSIYSDDGKLRILSWNYKLSDGSFGYNCHFLYKENKRANTEHYSVTTEQAFKPSENKIIKPSAWYGALYYNAIKQKDGYLLLGFGQYNEISKMKFIDVLKLGKKQISFGQKIFKPYSNSNKCTYRIVFEYSSTADMNLSYDKASRRFIFDHLSPEQASLEGIYQYYGPDFSVDALRLKKKFWTIEESIDQRNSF